MTTLSASLAQTGLPTLRANYMVRSALYRAYTQLPSNCVGGVFGKTLWIFGPDENTCPVVDDSSVPALGKARDVLELSDLAHIDEFHMRGWIAAVSSALERRDLPSRGGNSRDVAHRALLQVRDTDWECHSDAHQGLMLLKCLTQPTWWTTMAPPQIQSEERDLHFASLLNERQYRHDVAVMRGDHWTLAITDVPGFFLGSTRNAWELAHVAKGATLSRMGICGRMLHALLMKDTTPHTLLRHMFHARLNAAHELASTLQVIATCAADLGGRAYATHGDGTTIILPTAQYDPLLERLSNARIPLPLVLGAASLHRDPREAEHAAEQALVKARASMAASDEHFEAHIGNATPKAAQIGFALWRRLAERGDVVESWIGRKCLRSMTLSVS